MMFALGVGRGIPKAENKTDNLRECDKEGRGLKGQKILWTSYVHVASVVATMNTLDALKCYPNGVHDTIEGRHSDTFTSSRGCHRKRGSRYTYSICVLA